MEYMVGNRLTFTGPPDIVSALKADLVSDDDIRQITFTKLLPMPDSIMELDEKAEERGRKPIFGRRWMEAHWGSTSDVIQTIFLLHFTAGLDMLIFARESIPTGVLTAIKAKYPDIEIQGSHFEPYAMTAAFTKSKSEMTEILLADKSKSDVQEIYAVIEAVYSRFPEIQESMKDFVSKALLGEDYTV